MSTKVLVVDDKQMMRDSVGSTLQRAGYAVVAAGDGAAALKLADKHDPAVVVTDLKMPNMDGLELLAALLKTKPDTPVILMTAYGGVNDAVSAMKRGAFDFVQKPFEGDQLVNVVRRAVEQRRLNEQRESHVRNPHAADDATPNLIGRSAAMRSVAQQIRRIAHSSGTVLIQGESGTGKEVVARTLHAMSPRKSQVMLCLNCAALSTSLLESELFGHERGAFTGADQLRKGRFELADRGTLLLDEISEIGPTLQAKLLRVLQEGQFERVGASTTMQVDVRVVATTNRDLTRSVADGTFRQDLYYRLNVLPIVLPALRERLDDVPLLADHFLKQVALREGVEPKRLTDSASALLREHAWPGNVRELQNICERASLLSRSAMIEADAIRPWLAPAAAFAAPTPKPPPPAAATPNTIGSPPLQAPTSVAAAPSPATPIALEAPADFAVKPLEETEREHVLAALGHFKGNRTRTAEALGIGLRTLGLKLKKWKEQNLVAETV